MGKNLEQWLAVKNKFKLSDKHIQMARELGLNPKKFGSLDNHKQESWKAPLPIFIEEIYFKRFKKEAPDQVVIIEQKMNDGKKKGGKKKAERKKNRSAQLTALMQ